MKKKLLLLLLLLLPVFVLADVGAPGITEYDVRVSNPEGTDIIKWNSNTQKDEKKHVPYDTVIKNIMMEENIDGVVYGYSEEGTVKLADCEVISKEINLEDLKSEEKKEIYVYKEGAYLYKGPSKTYGKVDGNVMLPVGKEFSSNIYDDMFMYVEYNGTKGWVYCYQDYEMSPYKELSSVLEKDKKEIITIEDIKIKGDILDKESLNVTIPKGTKLTSSYYTYYHYGHYFYYVEYNGTKGFIPGGDEHKVGTFIENRIYTAFKNVKIYETTNTKSKVLGEIPKNSELVSDYVSGFDYHWYHVNYNGKSGYILWSELDEREVSEPEFIVQSDYGVYYINDSTPIYDNYKGNKTDKEITNKSVLSDYYNYDSKTEGSWVHIIEPTIGWIYEDPEINNVLFKGYIDDIKEFDKYKDTKDEPIENKDEPTENDIVPEKTPTNNISPSKAITYIVGAAIVLSLTIIVTILLVNKKKENKND
jgi:hypothetical protein